MKSLVRIAAMLGASIALGAVQSAVRGHPWIPNVASVRERLAGKSELAARHAELRATVGVTFEEFQRGIAEGAVVIDARPAAEFEKGHLAIDGPVPVLNVEPAIEAFQRNLDRLLPLQGMPILIYCTSETCELGEELYIQLERAGFFDMKIYFPGWEGLVKAGVPTRSGPDTWTAADAAALMGLGGDSPAAADDPAAPEEP